MRSVRGFTLVEILVALTLFAVVGGALLQLFFTGTRATRIATEHAHAVLYARSKLAELQAYDRLQPGVDEGRFGDRYAWRTELVETTLPAASDTVPFTPLKLSLRVSWGAPDREHELTVTSLLLSRRMPL